MEQVGQAVGVRLDMRCRHHVWGRHGSVQHGIQRQDGTYKCDWDAEAGVPCSTAGTSVVERLLVSKDAEGKPMTNESRQAEVRSPLMAVKPMPQQGQWVCFGPDRAFAYKLDTGGVIQFESTPNGCILTVELKAHQTTPANCKK